MRRWLFLILHGLLLLCLPVNLSAKTLIISDIDDTIKMSDILGSKVKIAFKALREAQAFAGMSELYQSFSENKFQIYYISGSPTYINSKIDKFLFSNHFPDPKNSLLRNSLKDDIFYYKHVKITQLLSRENPTSVIFIGDDTEYDPEIFEQISSENPGLVKNIYIRSVRNRPLRHLDNVTTFFAPIEIALSESLLDKLEKITQAYVEKSKNTGHALAFRYCPLDGRPQLDKLNVYEPQSDTYKLIKETQKKISQVCFDMKQKESIPTVSIPE